MQKGGYVYFISNENNTALYIGVTSDLEGRIAQHRSRQINGYAKRYNISKLVYYEQFPTIEEAIMREKQLKGWVRKKKEWLIGKVNPSWSNLSFTTSS